MAIIKWEERLCLMHKNLNTIPHFYCYEQKVEDKTPNDQTGDWS